MQTSELKESVQTDKKYFVNRSWFPHKFSKFTIKGSQLSVIILYRLNQLTHISTFLHVYLPIRTSCKINCTFLCTFQTVGVCETATLHLECDVKLLHRVNFEITSAGECMFGIFSLLSCVLFLEPMM